MMTVSREALCELESDFEEQPKAKVLFAFSKYFKLKNQSCSKPLFQSL